jgi:hypothetical protein
VTSEERIDTALEDSFPASDPAWWTLGVPAVAPTPHSETGTSPLPVAPEVTRPAIQREFRCA